MNGILTATAVVKDKNIEFQNEAFALLMERLKLEDVFEFVEGHETVKILHAGSDSVLCFQAGCSDRKMFMAVPCGEIEEAITLPDFIIFFENTLRNIFNCIKASIYITDNKGNLLMINSEAERTGGLTYDDIVGKNMQELIDCGFCTQSSSLAVIRSGMEESLVDSDDSGYQLLITGVPCRRQGNMELVVTVERDLRKITELRRELEYVNEKMQLYEEELGYLRERELKPIEAIYESNVMKKIVGLALKLTKSDMNVLIQGESGVGKEVIADIIYKYGNRESTVYQDKLRCHTREST